MGVFEVTDQLTQACFEQDIDTAESLIGVGVDINAVDSYGRKPLYCASAMGDLAMMELLIEARANPNIRTGLNDEVVTSSFKSIIGEGVPLLL